MLSYVFSQIHLSIALPCYCACIDWKPRHGQDWTQPSSQQHHLKKMSCWFAGRRYKVILLNSESTKNTNFHTKSCWFARRHWCWHQLPVVGNCPPSTCKVKNAVSKVHTYEGFNLKVLSTLSLWSLYLIPPTTKRYPSNTSILLISINTISYSLRCYIHLGWHFVSINNFYTSILPVKTCWRVNRQPGEICVAEHMK